jgi:hypothetical protein
VIPNFIIIWENLCNSNGMKFGGEYEFFRRRKKYSLNLADELA